MVNYINTYAGDGTATAGYSGDGLAATIAKLNTPLDVTIDSSGNLYIADTFNHCIRKVTTGGIISTYAGDGTLVAGYSGDSGFATSAKLNFPQGVTIDSSGNLYIADTLNHRIRKVDSFGVITTYAGDGSPTYGGDGLAATSAQIRFPQGVTIDSSGNLYIADTVNQRIRKVDSFGIISTYAGTGTSGYLISEDGGPATLAKLNAPRGVVISSSGDLYIADSSNNRIRKVDSFGIISTYAGTGTAGYLITEDGGAAIAAKLNNPRKLTIDSSDNVYIADTFNRRIRKVTSLGIISTYAGIDTAGYSGDGGDAMLAELNNPNGVTTDSSGNLYIADTNNHSIRKVYPFVIPFVICFNEGSKILCLVDDVETYVPIEQITNGSKGTKKMLVKTTLDGYLPVYKTGTNVVTNSKNDPIMYKCAKCTPHELFEDLILTKNHSILVDSLTDKQKEDTIKDFGQLCVTGNKYRLMCKFDDNFKGCVEDKNFNIWHIALENDNRYTNYGIYANGLLVESCSKRCIDEYMK